MSRLGASVSRQRLTVRNDDIWPYVLGSSAGIGRADHSLLEAPRSNRRPDQARGLVLVLKNSGRTPALNVFVRHEVTWMIEANRDFVALQREFAFKQGSSQRAVGSNVFPGQNFRRQSPVWISRKCVEEVRQNWRENEHPGGDGVLPFHLPNTIVAPM